MATAACAATSPTCPKWPGRSNWPGPGSAALNIGPDHSHSIMEKNARRTTQAARANPPAVEHLPASPADVPGTRASIAKAAAKLGWTPTVPISAMPESGAPPSARKDRAALHVPVGFSLPRSDTSKHLAHDPPRKATGARHWFLIRPRRACRRGDMTARPFATKPSRAALPCKSRATASGERPPTVH